MSNSEKERGPHVMSAQPALPNNDVAVPDCRICRSTARFVATVRGTYAGRNFTLARCQRCGYAFIGDPWLEFEQIYDDRYYAGRGADPLIDYSFELEHPELTIRTYEWSGIASVVRHLIGPLARRRWIDFGCGNGGLVRYLRQHHQVDAVGYEEGAIARHAAAIGVPVSGRAALAGWTGTADVVTAIEVLEHTYDPVAELRTMRALLRPGGLLFVTTGNALAHATHLDKWRYMVPEIHISFFEPRTLESAMMEAGFSAEFRSLGTGFDDILTFKVLKNLKVRRRSAVTDALPRRLIGAIADRVERLSEHPVGWAI
jgi:2-polyprenyl-3-methyl-5-hydroxy-6-metoxy-1,4-benzoquinol methylase